MSQFDKYTKALLAFAIMTGASGAVPTFATRLGVTATVTRPAAGRTVFTLDEPIVVTDFSAEVTIREIQAVTGLSASVLWTSATTFEVSIADGSALVDNIDFEVSVYRLIRA
jgi:hypothetical protein